MLYPDGSFWPSAGLGNGERILRLADLLEAGPQSRLRAFCLERDRYVTCRTGSTRAVGDLFLIVAALRTTGRALYQPSITVCYRVLTAGSWTQRMKERSAEYYLLHSEAMIRMYEGVEKCFNIPRTIFRYHVSGYYWVIAKDRLYKFRVAEFIIYCIRIDIKYVIKRLRTKLRMCS